MKIFILRAFSVFMMLTAIFSLFSASVFATEPTVSTKDISFELECEKSSVRTKEILNVTVTMKNNSSKDIHEFEFSFDFDTNRILGFTTDYHATLNGITAPNENSPVVLRQQGSTVKIYNYDPSVASSTRTALKSGQTLVIVFPMVVSENAASGTALFSVSDCKASDSSGSSMSIGGYPQANVTVSPTSNNANLSDIIVSVNDARVNISPAFSPDITQYTVSVGNSIPSLKINVLCSDDRATFTSDKPSQLNVGDNSFKFTVTAEDKTSTKVYTVNVHRLAPGETTVSTDTTTTTTTTATTETTATETTFTTETTETYIPDINDITEPATPPTSPSGQDASPEIEPEKDKSGSVVTLNLAALLGIVAAEIALFLLAFSAGYVTHKNAAQPQKYSVEELMEAQEKLDMQNRIAVGGAAAMPSAGYQPAALPAPSYPTGYTDPSQAFAQPGYIDPSQAAFAQTEYADPSQTAFAQAGYADPSQTAFTQAGYPDYAAAGDFVPIPEGMAQPEAVPNGNMYAPTDVYYQ